jgi:hypothetical protein
MAAAALHETLRTSLLRHRRPDGGFGFGPGDASAPEPTAVAALALADDTSRRWLVGQQAADGGFATFAAVNEDSSPAALAALALGRVPEGARALDYVVTRRARAIGESGTAQNPGRYGWGWTPETFSWVEPTARVLLATRVLRPTDRATRAEARTLLGQRQCRDGGWNYGNRAKTGVDPRGYLQTTAVGLQALDRGDPLSRGALRFVADRWQTEQGGLSLAQTIVALRLHREDPTPLCEALGRTFARTRFLDNTLALAWATLATGSGERLVPLGARP